MKGLSYVSLVASLVASSLLMLPGCMTVSDKQTIVQNTDAARTFGGKKIAVLPVKAQTSLAPDSVVALRNELNKRIALTLRGKLPSAHISDISVVADQLNQTGALNTFEQLVATYENTGVIDKRHTATLGRALGSDYLLLSRLKAEKMDIVISRGLGASLEVMLIGANTGEVAWGGSGEWKRGGIFGAGKTTPDEAAQNLIALAFASLRPESGASQPPVERASSPPPAESTRQPKTSEAGTDRSGEKNAPASEAPKLTKAPEAGPGRKGDRMPVAEIQKRLRDLGYSPGPADGKMGKGTIEALKKFQQDNNLAITGQADGETVDKLRQQKAEVRTEPPKLAREPAVEAPQKTAPPKVKSATDL